MNKRYSVYIDGRGIVDIIFTSLEGAKNYVTRRFARNQFDEIRFFDPVPNGVGEPEIIVHGNYILPSLRNLSRQIAVITLVNDDVQD